MYINSRIIIPTKDLNQKLGSVKAPVVFGVPAALSFSAGVSKNHRVTGFTEGETGLIKKQKYVSFTAELKRSFLHIPTRGFNRAKN
ncbi:MAG: hypothetical protein EA344_02870 [Alkalicoccus sp.]|nr:MAG: hypothetical protein EA344_02870 [Alkalicoccus sp.]